MEVRGKLFVGETSPRLLLNEFSRRVPDVKSFHGFGHGD